MSRGSKLNAASMVRMTTPAKQIAPVPGVTEANSPIRTSAVRMAIMNTSIIDQRPMTSTSLYSRVRSPRAAAEPRWVVTSIQTRSASFSMGTAMLATNTSRASGHMRYSTSSCTPPRMVLGWPRPRRTTVITGRKLAGTYSMAAAASRAQQRARLSGLRTRSLVWQRVQGSPGSARLTCPQVSQPIRAPVPKEAGVRRRRLMASHMACSSSQASAATITSIRPAMA